MGRCGPPTVGRLNVLMTLLPGVAQLSRAARYVRTHGTVAAGRRVRRELLPLAHLREAHVWYELSLTGASHVQQPGDISMTLGSPERFPLLDQLDSISAAEAERRLSVGAQWWLVVENEKPLFSCWIFQGTAPVLAARGGQLPLPADTVVLEDSVTAPAARGRGIAPRAWCMLADSLHEQGKLRMLTKVAFTNTPSRRAVVKAGFREIALVRYHRILGWSRTTVRPFGSTAGWLADALPT